jgi:hypothetical protein
MPIPDELLTTIRRENYVKAITNNNLHGGKFPPNRSEIIDIYKNLRKTYKRNSKSDLKYLSTSIILFARSRNIDDLKRLASFERKYGYLRLGLRLQKALLTLGVGAKRRLVFEDSNTE